MRLAVIQAQDRLAAAKLCREGLEVLVDSELCVSAQCILAANRVLACMSGSTGRMSNFSSLFSTAHSLDHSAKPQQLATNVESNQDDQGLQHKLYSTG